MNPSEELERLYDDWEQYKACNFVKRLSEAYVGKIDDLKEHCAIQEDVKSLQGQIKGVKYAQALPDRLFNALKSFYDMEKKKIEQRIAQEGRDVDRDGQPIGSVGTPEGDDD